MNFELPETVKSLLWVLVFILAIIVFVIYFLRREKLTLGGVEEDVLLRTGASAGGNTVNMYEMGQPIQGDQYKTPSYDRLWVHNIPTKLNREGFSGGCGMYQGDSQYIDSHLNLKTPNGESVYNYLTDEDLYNKNANEVDHKVNALVRGNRMEYEKCLKAGGNSSNCAVPFKSYVDNALMGEAWKK